MLYVLIKNRKRGLVMRLKLEQFKKSTDFQNFIAEEPSRICIFIGYIAFFLGYVKGYIKGYFRGKADARKYHS